MRVWYYKPWLAHKKVDFGAVFNGSGEAYYDIKEKEERLKNVPQIPVRMKPHQIEISR